MRILLLLIACMGLSCADQDNPIAPTGLPAGKVQVDESLVISWPCDAEVDSVWTVFYGSAYRFQTHGERVLFSQYLDSNRKRQYWASETLTRFGRLRSGFRSSDGACDLWSDAIDNDSFVVRIYRGEVNYLYRNTPNARYVLAEGDVQYPIASVEADGAGRHRNFYSVHNRNEPRPAGLVEIRSTHHISAYYLPVNFSAAALDTLTDLPEDDRPYLENPIVREVNVLRGAEPIDLPDDEPPSGGGEPSSGDGCSLPNNREATLFYGGKTYESVSIDYGSTPDGSDTACGALSSENRIFAGGASCPAGEAPGCQRFAPPDGIGDDIHLWLCFACE